MADTILDGTSHRGSAHPMAKLTERQVIAIRADDRTADTIAAEYGIAEATVRGLWRRVNWSWLEAAS
ncbi:MAG: hypothetical protein GY929_18090 [Actinomycetia bacterium]|nr:hypothetical protein [Actinomycetes bacterium]